MNLISKKKNFLFFFQLFSTFFFPPKDDSGQYMVKNKQTNTHKGEIWWT